MDAESDRLKAGANPPKVAIAMRSYNDRDVIRGTLEMIRRQTYPNFELWNFDSSSKDGTFEIIQQYNVPERIFQNDSASYNPGTVLNDAVRKVGGDVVVFINSDATPESEDWLEKLIAPLADPRWVPCMVARPCDRTAVPCSSRTPSVRSETAVRPPSGSTSSPWPTPRPGAMFSSAFRSKPESNTPKTSSGPSACARQA